MCFFFLLRTCHQQLCTIPFARKISCSYIFVFFKLILLDAFKPAYLQTIAKVLFHAFCKVEIYLVNFFKNHFSQIVEKENWYNKFPVLVIFLLEAESAWKSLSPSHDKNKTEKSTTEHIRSKSRKGRPYKR